MRRLMLRCLRVYQQAISPWLPRMCRFYPSCSSYACQVIDRFGIWRGLRLTAARIVRCHPWHPGGVDLPPER